MTTPIPETTTTTGISDARLASNRANAKLSTGPSPEGIAASCLNHTIHGLARHQNGTFKILTSEDPAAFEALLESLTNDHAPLTGTEGILVNSMAESHWLAQRAQRLQDTCMDPNTGEIKDEKKASLYLRYQTTHTRAFHKSLNDLQKLRSERRKAELGFEAQKRQEEENKRKIERQEMKKEAHASEMVRKEGLARHKAVQTATLRSKGLIDNPYFHPFLNEELAKVTPSKEEKKAETQAA